VADQHTSAVALPAKGSKDVWLPPKGEGAFFLTVLWCLFWIVVMVYAVADPSGVHESRGLAFFGAVVVFFVCVGGPLNRVRVHRDALGPGRPLARFDADGFVCVVGRARWSDVRDVHIAVDSRIFGIDMHEEVPCLVFTFDPVLRLDPADGKFVSYGTRVPRRSDSDKTVWLPVWTDTSAEAIAIVKRFYAGPVTECATIFPEASNDRDDAGERTGTPDSCDVRSPW
jgi:hypothetical protein